MLKKRMKLFALVFVALLLVASTCFATDEAVVTSVEDPNATAESTNTTTENAEGTENEAVTDNGITDEMLANLVSSDYFSTAEESIGNYTFSKTVDGNAFLIGNEITVTSEIAGDLFVVANKLIIADTVSIYGNVFAMANEIEINGTVYDLYSTSSKLRVGYDGIIYRDMHSIASEVTMIGRIGRNMMTSSNNISFVEKDTETEEDLIGMVYGNLQHPEGAKVTYPTNEETGEIDTTMSIAGEIIHANAHESIGSLILDYVLALLATLIFVAVAWLLFTWLTPNFVQKVAGYISKKFPWVILFGLGGVILGTIICGVLILFPFLSLVTSKLGFIILLLYVLTIAISYPTLCISIGTFLNNKTKKPSKAKGFGFTMLITTAIWVLQSISFFINFIVGYVFVAIITVIGLGMILMSIVKRKEKAE